MVWRRVTWYSQLLAIVLALGIFGIGFWLGSEMNSTQSSAPPLEQRHATNTVVPKDTSALTKKVFTKFELEKSVSGCTDFNSTTSEYTGPCEHNLIGIASDGTRVAVFDSVLKSFWEQTSDAEKDTELEVSYASPEHGKVIFSTICHCDASAYLFSLDTTSLAFTKLANGRLGHSYGDLASPDNRIILRMDPEGKKLLLTDVILDNEVTAVTVHGTESLINQIGGIGGDPLGSYRWLSTSTIEYKVYEGDIPDDAERDKSRMPLETRTYTIGSS